LKPYRKDVFLACKTTQRDAKGARMELEQSLKRANTDHFDLYQFHAVSSMEDVEKILAPGGAAELFVKAREEGKARYLGFSAHSAEAALTLMDRMELDSVLFPVNCVCFGQGNFGPQILEKAKSKGLARLALKAMAWTTVPDGEEPSTPKCWYKPVENRPAAERGLRFTLSQDVTAAVPPGNQNLYAWALDIAANIKPMSDAEQRELLTATKGIEPIFRG
jgi:predicted aldo/keto reductase-like oxidoreductase